MRYLDRYLRRFAWWRKWRGLPEPVELTIEMITMEALRILGEDLKFPPEAKHW